jgi:hypothetical protein
MMIETVRRPKPREVLVDDVDSGTRDSLQLLLADISAHPLLTQA